MAKKKKKTDSELYAEVFGGEFPGGRLDWVGANYQKVVSDIKHRVGGRFKLDAAMLDDLAASAAVYALRAYVNGKRPWPATAADWVNMAVSKARNLAKDFFAEAKRTPMVYLDEDPVEIDGEAMAESRGAVDAAMQVWRDQQAEKERAILRASVRYAIPKVVAEMNTRNPIRTLNIVKAAYLSDMPVPEICQRFEGLKPNALFVLLFRFRDCYAECGKRYMAEFEDWYSDDIDRVA